MYGFRYWFPLCINLARIDWAFYIFSNSGSLIIESQQVGKVIGLHPFKSYL